jgi:hypothetical protein
MPPQQPDRLLDVTDNRFDFCAHGVSDLMADVAGCNAAGRKPQVKNPGKAPQ